MTAGQIRTVLVSSGRRRADAVTPGELVELAGRRLPDLLRPNGLFCFEVDQHDPSPGEALAGPALHGASVRYSIIVLLGLLQQRHAAGSVEFDVERHLGIVQRYRPGLGVGDLGLLLWAETRSGSPGVAATVAALERRTDGTEVLDGLVGMELAWVLLGAVAALTAGHPTQLLVDRAVEAFGHRTPDDGALVLHRSPGRTIGRAWRSRYPNFATEIYSLLALVELGRHGLVDGAIDRARRLADSLIALRLDDGGWSWLYDAHRERVVEAYEVYSVHQDAMAPMALLPLAAVTGDDRYRQAAYEGLRWLSGQNPLGIALVDRDRGIVHRSIRRPATVARVHLAANTGLSALGADGHVDRGGFEVDRTCRPYHLGWILEAWSPVVGLSSDRLDDRDDTKGGRR